MILDLFLATADVSALAEDIHSLFPRYQRQGHTFTGTIKGKMGGFGRLLRVVKMSHSLSTLYSMTIVS